MTAGCGHIAEALQEFHCPYTTKPTEETFMFPIVNEFAQLEIAAHGYKCTLLE
jgi:hypothetical protein